MTPIRVLVIDDSQLVRTLLSRMLASDPDLDVVGTAIDAYDAREKVKQLHPDVLTLDVEMPGMDGLRFLGNLMRLHPLPVVMVSTLTERGSQVTMKALELGAVDFVSKPRVDIQTTLQVVADEIIGKVKAAARANLRALAAPIGARAPARPAAAPASMGSSRLASDRIIAIGASTGGTEAIRKVLETLPADAPPVLATQHIPAAFSASFANRLDGLCAITVQEAKAGQVIERGNAYIAPGDQHLKLSGSERRYVCSLSDAEPVNRHRPSVEVLFDSVARVAGNAAVAALLTGMGKDGSAALCRMRQQGIRTIAQDEATSVIWGMPGTAVKLGGAEQVLPLEAIGPRLLEFSGY